MMKLKLDNEVEIIESFSVDKLSLIDKILDVFGLWMTKGILKPGDLIPSEKSLAKTFDVSQISVRQALKALYVLGILEISHGSRTYLNKSVSKVLVNPIKFMTLLHGVGTLELLETRKIIETELAKSAALNASEDDVKIIESSLESLKNSFGDMEKFIDLEIKVHNNIFLASKNKILIALMHSINNLLIESRKETSRILKRFNETYLELSSVFEAIRERDPDKAGKAMLKHLEKVEEYYKG